MRTEQLNELILAEIQELEILHSLLEDQSKFVLNGNPMEMEAIVPKLNACNKNIAILEMKRRELTDGELMSKIVNGSNNIELKNSYRKIKRLIQSSVDQKDFNLMQIKQRLNFTNNVLNILNPHRSFKTYNSYGKLKK